MLNLKNTRFVNSKHLPVLPGTEIADEGIALVAVMHEGKTHVKPSTGVAGEVFAGVSFSRNVIPQFVSAVVEDVVTGSHRVALGRTPVAGQIFVTATDPATGDVTPLDVVSGSPAAGEVQIANGNAIVHASVEGQVVKAAFHYVPSATEARMIKGNLGSSQLASSVLEQIGVLTNNQELSTSYFDASVDWAGATSSGSPQVVKLGADGKFTIGGSGAVVPNCSILAAPGVDSPFLTLSIGQ